MPDLQPGTVFAGHRIEGIAGRGGMGTVYRATHIALDHVVALKVISADLAADDAFRERFRSESRIAVSLRHPNVVPIHHAGEEDGLLFVTMDLVDGPDLRRMLIANGTLSPDRAIKIIGQVASALDVAHSRGLVHRDIKPGNILVERDSDDRAFLTDFGLAKRFDQATDAGALTRTGAFVGTLDYVAPEQIRGDRVDARTDVYALGCVLYESISGRAPFADREENVAKIYAHLQDEPPWLPGDGGTEGELDEVIARALAKEPADRYPSAGDLARAAAAAIEGHEVLRSAERSVATGKAAPETGEPANPPLPITDTMESVIAPDRESEPPSEPEPRAEPAEPEPEPETNPEPAATEPFAVAAGTTAAHSDPTRVTEAAEPPAASPPPPSAASKPGAAGGPRWGRIGLVAGALVAIMVVAVVALGGGGDSNDDGGGGGGFAPSEIDDQRSVPGFPVGVSVGSGLVTVATRSGQRVDIFNESNGSKAGSVPLPGDGEEVTIADEAAWVSVPDADQVMKVPLDGGDPTPIDVTSAPYGVAFDGSSIWAALPETQQIVEIDPGSGQVSDPVPVDGSKFPSEITFGDTRLWVVDRGGAQVIAVEPDDAGTQEAQNVGDNPKGVVVSDGTVWVASTDDGTVDRFTTDLGELDPIDVGGAPRLLDAGSGRIWVANEKNYVSVIDVATGTVQKLDVGGSPEGVAVGDGENARVWVTSGKGDGLTAIRPGAPNG